jgi:hypothetical protein
MQEALRLGPSLVPSAPIVWMPISVDEQLLYAMKGGDQSLGPTMPSSKNYLKANSV